MRNQVIFTDSSNIVEIIKGELVHNGEVIAIMDYDCTRVYLDSDNCIQMNKVMIIKALEVPVLQFTYPNCGGTKRKGGKRRTKKEWD